MRNGKTSEMITSDNVFATARISSLEIPKEKGDLLTLGCGCKLDFTNSVKSLVFGDAFIVIGKHRGSKKDFMIIDYVDSGCNVLVHTDEQVAVGSYVGINLANGRLALAKESGGNDAIRTIGVAIGTELVSCRSGYVEDNGDQYEFMAQAISFKN